MVNQFNTSVVQRLGHAADNRVIEVRFFSEVPNFKDVTMVIYTHLDLIHACENILGTDVVTAMRNADIGMPRIHDVAIKAAFMDDTQNVSASILRQAAIDLNTLGQYNYDSE